MKLAVSLSTAILLLVSIPATSFAAIPLSHIPHVAQVFGLARTTTGVAKINFVPMKWVDEVNYTLTYAADGVPQGVVGTFDPNGSTVVTKEIFMGTCSGNTCVKHQDIEDVEVTAEFTFLDGTTKTTTKELITF